MTEGVCLFTRPDNATMEVNYLNGAVLEEGSGQPMDGYSAVIDEDGLTCGLQIPSVEEEDLGQWRCKMNDDDMHSKFHVGTFQVLPEEEGYLKDVRLPRHMNPLLYVVEIWPFLAEANSTFRGRSQFVVIHNGDHQEAGEYRHQIFMHSSGLIIDEDAIVVRSARTLNEVLGIEYDLERQFLVLHVEDPVDFLSPTMTFNTVSIDYVGSLEQNLVGFYSTSYTDEDGNEVPLGVTDFEPIDARKAFPCLDEPDMKARSQLMVYHDGSMSAYSNQELTDTIDKPDLGEGWVRDRFALAREMSTYLYAWIISDFVRKESTSDPRVAVIYPPGKESQTPLALDVGSAVLPKMEEHFAIPFALPKLDMVAIPDFKAGAMENWGMMTFRESSLLFDDEVSTKTDRERVVEVISHEISHQWFGNLVTMAWWTDLWLNEGFATYMENYGKDYYDPELRSKDRVILVDLHDVFEIDSLTSTTPLSNEVMNPAYDLSLSRISYGKGNCLLRMTEHAITYDVFNTGVKTYLDLYQYENAERSALWTLLDAAAHTAGTLDEDLDLGEILEGWSVKGGYPVVTVDAVHGNELSISQTRFYLTTQPPESIETWYIPINFAYPGESFDNTVPSVWMKDSEVSLTVEVDSTPYIMNVKETGYYRVNYNEDNWLALIQVLKDDESQIDPQNRAQLLDDSFNLARAGQLAYEHPLEMSLYAEKEVDYIPIKAMLNSFNYLDEMFREEPEYLFLQEYLKELMMSKYEQYGFEEGQNEVYMDTLIREELIDLMCAYDNDDCVEKSQDYFAEWMDAGTGPNPIPLDIKAPVYNSAIMNGGDSEWDFLWDQYISSPVDSERKRILKALGLSQKKATLLNYLDKTIDVFSGLKEQDASYVYNAVGSTALGRVVQMDWLEDNFDDIQDYFGTSFPTVISDIVESFARGGKTQAEINRLEEFLEENEEALGGTADTVVDLAIETINLNMRWFADNFDFVADWLDDRTDVELPTTEEPTTTNEPTTMMTTPEATSEDPEATSTEPVNPDVTTTEGEPDPETTPTSGTGSTPTSFSPSPGTASTPTTPAAPPPNSGTVAKASTALLLTVVLALFLN